MNAVDQKFRYSMVIEWEPEGSVFVVTVPELPGCRTHGDPYEEAVKQGQEAIEGRIDAMRHWKQPIPPPRYFDLDAIGVPTEETVGVG
jgi:predicted RNase H-like HicB family nuclease